MTYASAHHTKCDLNARATRSKSFFNSDSDGNRTRVTAVKGRCLNRLTTEPRYEHLATVFWSLTCDAYRTLSESRPAVEDELSSPVMTGVIAPRVGLEPTTPRLTAACSTIELSRIILQ